MRLKELIAKSLKKKVKDLTEDDIERSLSMYVIANTNFDNPKDNQSELLVFLTNNEQEHEYYGVNY